MQILMIPRGEGEYFPLTPDLCFYGFTGWSSWWESFPFQKAVFHFSQGEPWALTCLWSCVSDSYEHPVWRRAIWNSQSLQIYPRYNHDNVETFVFTGNAHAYNLWVILLALIFPPVRTDLWLVLFPCLHWKQWKAWLRWPLTKAKQLIIVNWSWTLLSIILICINWENWPGSHKLDRQMDTLVYNLLVLLILNLAV